MKQTETRFTLTLDLVAGLVTGFLILVLSIVILVGTQLGVRVNAKLPENSLLGPYEALVFSFSEPVDESLATPAFFIQPDIKGNIQWLDSKTMRFVPQEAYQPGVLYQAVIAPGVLTSRGDELKKAASWEFEVRPPQIVYMTRTNDASQLWTFDVATEEITPLTTAEFKILNFDTSHNGEFLIFAAFNETGGMDLWQVLREGSSPTLILQCGRDRCSVPAISPDGKMIAYVREAAGPTADLQFGSPRIWVFNLQTRQDAALYEDQQIIGYGPEWSPDGTYLSSFDGIKDELRLIDLVTNRQLIIPSQIGNPITWSSNSDSFIYTDLAQNEFGVHTIIKQAKLSIDETIILFGEHDQHDYRYNSISGSPVDSSLVIGLRPNANDASAALWLMNPVSRDGFAVAEQEGYIYNNPYWDPWGRALVFQQFRLKGTYEPEIAYWLPGFNEIYVVAEGIMPQWLP